MFILDILLMFVGNVFARDHQIVRITHPAKHNSLPIGQH